jgi:hypothetical protein
MIGRRLHLGLDATSVSDILSFASRPKGYLEKHLTMILVNIDKEEVCLMYRSIGVYDYDTTIDWFIFNSETFRDKSSVHVNGTWEEVLGAFWLNGERGKEAGPGNPTSGWIYQGIYNLYKMYTSMKIPLPPSSK